MAVGAARAMEVTMLLMSGKSLGYGESKFNPGSQWYRNLSVVGGPQRLLEPVVKWAQQVPAPETLYESVVRAGEMAQRQPKEPPICVSRWRRCCTNGRSRMRCAKYRSPRSTAVAGRRGALAGMIAKARCPVISVENATPSQDAFDALIELAELAAIPVVEGQGAFFGNFPKSHDLYLGAKIEPLQGEMDLALLVESRAPWYPPSNVPQDAEIVAISECPLKGHMVYQTMHAEHYLDGDVAVTLRLLSEALRTIGVDRAEASERRTRWATEHKKWLAGLRTAEEKSTDLQTITVPLLIKTLREVMPADTAYVDETIVHAGAIRDHLHWSDPLTFFRAPSGLGQGLGYALGVKLAMPNRPVV